jgi:hypothetical protein
MSPFPQSDIEKRPSERRFEPDEISIEYLVSGWLLNIPRNWSRIGSKVSASIQISKQKIFLEREMVFTARGWRTSTFFSGDHAGRFDIKTSFSGKMNVCVTVRRSLRTAG